MLSVPARSTHAVPSTMAQYAVLRYKCTIAPHHQMHIEPYPPYISKGLPDALTERLVATYQHTCTSGQGSKRQKLDAKGRVLEIDQWTHDDVPLYTMLNWIGASGWELKSSSTGGLINSKTQSLEHYVFMKLPGHD